MAASHDRILVFGDNHGDAETLAQVADETASESFDYIVHVGDLTNTTQERDDPRDDATIAAEQIERIRPPLERLAERGELVYIWGNRDGYGDPMPADGLGVGTHVPRGESRVVAGQRFTTDPEAVDADSILVTHAPHLWAVDHFEGRAYFSGHTHKGRYRKRFLNSAFLYRDDTHGADALDGGYFIAEVGGEPPWDVEFRNLGGLKRVICSTHIERGVGYQPHFHNCRYCHYEGELEEEMLTSAYHALAERGASVDVSPEGSIVQSATPLGPDPDRRLQVGFPEDAPAVDREGLVEYACGLWIDPPAGFREDFEAYLDGLAEPHPLASFVTDGAGRIVRR
jgi:predicted phosphodiesterase